MRKPVFAWIIAGAACLMAGYIALGSAREIRRLNSLLRQVQADREELCRANAAFLEGKVPTNVVERGSILISMEATTNLSAAITEEEIRTSLEMNVRSRKGEYILQFERPTDRKVMESAVNDFASRMASNSTPGLSNMLAQLGVSKEHARLLEDHAYKIMVASLEAEEAISQVLRARVEYDRRVRSIMSEDTYADYRRFEALKPALSEYVSFERFAAQKKVVLDPAYRAQVVSLMEKAKGYTELTFHGPYDTLTPVAVGQTMVTNGLTKQLNQLSEAAILVKRRAFEANLPESYAHLLEAYYGRGIQKLKDTIASIIDPTSGRSQWGMNTNSHVFNGGFLSFLPEETNWDTECLSQPILDSTGQQKAARN